MGIFSGVMHWSTKKTITSTIEGYKGLTPDQRAGLIFHIWLMRGVNLAVVSEASGNAHCKGLFIPVYYYKKGAESVLTRLIKMYESSGNIQLLNATKHHLFTNLAVSYPDEGYGAVVREMWKTLFCNHTDLQEVATDLAPLLGHPTVSQMVANNDITLIEFVDQPDSILPHFMVLGHPLSSRLLEEDKLANACGFY